ncbi:hypothetical protein OJAV_G00020820 [Oryzias javanicus]|uniref:Uncharacterized protein n=1 Tax=Oryzias javanicus TaxID=123683 RepID=A0A437DHE1_ORYJA|nr:hypothetical protein OJAV_G00020820 [Oryzias javanicus]
MRSLSCSSEPLPLTYFGSRYSHDCEATSAVKDPSGGACVSSVTGCGPLSKIPEMPSTHVGKQGPKKLTKFYSVPSFCNPWVQCAHPQLCCPIKAFQASQKHLSTSSRAKNCIPNPPVCSTPTGDCDYS